MKKVTKRLSLMLAILFIFALFNAFAIAPETNEFLSEERISIEYQSNLAYSKILESFGVNAILIEGEDQSKYPEHPEYGEYYAGAYLNDEGKLVVLLATEENNNYSNSNIISDEIQTSKEISKLSAELKNVAIEIKEIAEDETVIFQTAKYSYAYLTELMDYFNSEFEKNVKNPESIWSEITGFELLDDKNCISINILNLDDKKIERFKNEVINSDAIVFSESGGYAESTATSLYAGNAVTCNGYGGSIGYQCRILKNGTYFYGFVTAAHLMRTLNTSAYNSSNTLIGYTHSIQYGGKVDAAFVNTYSGITMTNKIQSSSGTATVAATTMTPAVNSTICKAGASTYYATGKVTSLSKTAYYQDDNVTLTNLIAASNVTVAGDSGGIVYDSSGYIIGITTGQENGTLLAVTASNIYAAIGAFPY